MRLADKGRSHDCCASLGRAAEFAHLGLLVGSDVAVDQIGDVVFLFLLRL
jgi:hypothetical protein